MNLTGNGINMCYGRHTGYGGYGDWARGGRQILLNQQSLGLAQEVQTWIRLEDGTISGKVTLNSTYRQDRYHRVMMDTTSSSVTSLGSANPPPLEMRSMFVLLVTAVFIVLRI